MLEWMGKKKVVNHHNDVPFHVLERKWTFRKNSDKSEATLTLRKTRNVSGASDESELDDESGNMIIHGDNLVALKSLLPRFEGRVKCIYIDPPYNTGNEGWVYNDNVNDPQINKWFNKIVGKEGEDFSRHDKWLCMMYPRLKLLQKLLSNDGAVFISIDDNELYTLKLVCDEIFGANCFVGDISWQRTYSTRNDAKGIVSEVEHILAYSKTPGWQPKKLPRTAEMDKKYKNPDNDVAPWTSDNPCAPGAATHQGMVYAIQHPFTGELLYPAVSSCWRYEQETMFNHMSGWAEYELRDIDDAAKRAAVCGVKEGEVRQGVKAIMLKKSLAESKKSAEAVLKRGQWPKFYFTKNGKGGIRRKTYLENVGGVPPTNLWEYKDVGHTDEAKKELKAIFGGDVPFDTPKPTRLIERILQIAADKDSIVLDSFAGSGTTAHAVLNANAKDGGTRRFVLVEMMDYAESVTAERVKRVMGSATYPPARPLREAKSLEWCETPVAPVGFGFYELGPQLMVDGVLNEEVPTEKIREYVYYTETRGANRTIEQSEQSEQSNNSNNRTIEQSEQSNNTKDPYLLGVAYGVAYYFCYEKDKSMTLNRTMLKKIKTKAESYVVYADACTLSAEELEKLHITFKKIPRDVTRF